MDFGFPSGKQADYRTGRLSGSRACQRENFATRPFYGTCSRGNCAKLAVSFFEKFDDSRRFLGRLLEKAVGGGLC